jgi:hypothetical protein
MRDIIVGIKSVERIADGSSANGRLVGVERRSHQLRSRPVVAVF